MMPSYSLRSRRNLDSADPRLIDVFDEVIKHFDCSVICGHRDMVQQEAAYHSGNSKVTWPNSMHNRSPSRAVDVLPYPIDWNDREGMAHLAGFVIATGKSKGLNIKWGGDWAQDRKSSDTNFFDGGHYEIVDA